MYNPIEDVVIVVTDLIGKPELAYYVLVYSWLFYALVFFAGSMAVGYALLKFTGDKGCKLCMAIESLMITGMVLIAMLSCRAFEVFESCL